LVIGLTLLTSVDSSAATIERVGVRRIGNVVVEVEFNMRGAAPRWHLQGHGQELWLDLEHSSLDASVEPVSAPVVFPLTHVSVRDLGAGRVRLVIRIRGEVDYAVAQLPQVLVVRIAASSEAVDLERPLLSEMERSGRSSVSVRTLAGTPLAHPRAPVYPPQAGAQTVQHVAQRLVAVPSTGQDRPGPTVAIDAGHGGFDPGTESAGGVAEKTVALAIARRLAAALEARGINTELTRNDDEFLSLAERTELANRARAGLFVSVHLNSSPDWNTSGIETYYLNNTTDRATIRLAQIENGEDYGALGRSDLNYILTNLRQDYKAHESSSLARMIEGGVAASVDTTLGLRVNTLGAKRGPFYVLVGAAMPSVLIECGFLSNPREAQLLIQPGYQDALADGIAEAIMHYFKADAAVGNL
jgi:N-acetylmuramoyl-L-alanine amidase